MTVRLSYDGCRSWPLERVLNEGAAAYSDLCVADDGMVCCLYESGSGNDPYESADPGAVQPGVAHPRRGRRRQPLTPIRGSEKVPQRYP